MIPPEIVAVNKKREKHNLPANKSGIIKQLLYFHHDISFFSSL